jgi:hypothetical protein
MSETASSRGHCIGSSDHEAEQRRRRALEDLGRASQKPRSNHCCVTEKPAREHDTAFTPEQKIGGTLADPGEIFFNVLKWSG